MSAITRCEDVWILITDLLAKQDLCSLARVCKQLHEWTSRRLYRSIDIPRLDGLKSWDHVFFKRLAQTLIERPELRPYVLDLNARDGFRLGKVPMFDVNVPSYLENFWSSVARRGFVDLTVHACDEDTWRKRSYDLTTSSPSLFSFLRQNDTVYQVATFFQERKHIAELPVAGFLPGIDADWQENLGVNKPSYRTLDRLMALIVSLTPNLRSLDFEVFKAPNLTPRLFGNAVETLAGSHALPSFTNLKQLRLCGKRKFGRRNPFEPQPEQNEGKDDKISELSNLDVYLKLPSLECISAFGFGRDGASPHRVVKKASTQSPKLGHLEPGTSKIRHLELRNCNIDGESLKEMVGFSKHLRTFIHDKCHIPTAEIQLALEPAVSSLSAVWIDYCPPYCGYFSDHRPYFKDSTKRNNHPALDLSSFTNLRYVHVSAAFLVTPRVDWCYRTPKVQPQWTPDHPRLVERLPQSTTTLHITRCFLYEFDVGLELQHLLTNPELLPDLKEIIVELSDYSSTSSQGRNSSYGRNSSQDTDSSLECRWSREIKSMNSELAELAERSGIHFLAIGYRMGDTGTPSWIGNKYPQSIINGDEWVYKF